MQWWGYIALGIGLIIIASLFYRNRTNPNVHFEGSPLFITAASIIFGLILIVGGIFSYFLPRVLKWMHIYSDLPNIIEIILFLVLQAILICFLFESLVYKIIIKRENS